MRSALIENGKVTNVIVGELDGYVPCGDDVGIGYGYDGSVFTAPIIVVPQIDQLTLVKGKIAELEAQQTPRLMREALAGVQFAIDKLAAIDAEISVLRGQLV